MFSPAYAMSNKKERAGNPARSARFRPFNRPRVDFKTYMLELVEAAAACEFALGMLT